MKRRKFLAAGLLSFLGTEAWAAPKKKAAAKPARASSKKKSAHRKSKAPQKPTGPTARTADDPIIEKPPPGSSASRLPPVKAQEPPLEWHTFEITATINPPKGGPLRLWLPLPLSQDTLYQRTLGHSWDDNADSASLRRLPDGDLEVSCCTWKSRAEPMLQWVTTVTTADRHFDVTRRTIAPEREDILRRNLQASRLIPNDGEAHRLGEQIVGRIKDPVAQAKAIYDWVIDNTLYNPGLAGVGAGDARLQLEQRQYGGRSADIAALFVALCRGIGIPARPVYGLRVGASRLFKSLGLSGTEATGAQHVRAEFYVPGYGWIPVDPSDVRRVLATGEVSERDGKFSALRKVLFGLWEMNWIAYNVGSEVSLPGLQETLPFFILPRLENADGLIEGGYALRARQID